MDANFSIVCGCGIPSNGFAIADTTADGPAVPVEAPEPEPATPESVVKAFLKGHAKQYPSDEWVGTTTGCGRLRVCYVGHEEWIWIGKSKYDLSQEDRERLDGERHGCIHCGGN